MPKIKGDRLNFRKQVSEPWLLKIIKELSDDNNETMLKSCYKLLQFGGREYLKIRKEKK